MRTNIEIDDEKMKLALKYSGLKTKKEVIEKALDKFTKQLLALELLKLEGSDIWEGNLDEMRTAGYE